MTTQKPYWVKISIVKDLTGWGAEKMRQARENGYIKWKKDSGGFFYDLNSLHPLLTKNKTEQLFHNGMGSIKDP